MVLLNKPGRFQQSVLHWYTQLREACRDAGDQVTKKYKPIHFAVDGKCSCGSWGIAEDFNAIHFISVWAFKHGVPLGLLQG